MLQGERRGHAGCPVEGQDSVPSVPERECAGAPIPPGQTPPGGNSPTFEEFPFKFERIIKMHK